MGTSQSVMCSVSVFLSDTNAKVEFLFYRNKEKKELFVLRGISVIKMAKVATYYMLLQFLPRQLPEKGVHFFEQGNGVFVCFVGVWCEVLEHFVEPV